MNTPNVPEKAVPVLYLDIDGTVRKGKAELGRFVNGPEDVEVFPEAVTMMRRWKAGAAAMLSRAPVAMASAGGYEFTDDERNLAESATSE